MFFWKKKNTVPWEETAVGRRITESAEENFRRHDERRREYERLCNPERLEVLNTAWPVFVFFSLLHMVFIFVSFFVFRPLFIFCGVSLLLFLVFYFFPPFWRGRRYLFMVIMLSWFSAAAMFFMFFLHFDIGPKTEPLYSQQEEVEVSVTEDNSSDDYEDFLRKIYGDDSFLQTELFSVEEGS